MEDQLRQDYNVDQRYSQSKRSVDNGSAKAFTLSFINRKKAEAAQAGIGDRQTEDRFIVRGPGDRGYSFRNGFRASK
jgi:hypothetical protein